MHLPPEWHTQAGVMLTWPHHQGDWGDDLAAVEAVFIEIAGVIARFEQVIISCLNNKHRQHVCDLLTTSNCKMDQVALYCAPSNDVWVRDHGPITVIPSPSSDQDITLLDFHFNGWGNKYPASLDNQVSQSLYRQGAFNPLTLKPIDFVLEGGSIESDGQGSLMTTTRCLLSPHRNPEHTLEQTTLILKNLLGMQQIHWLEHGWLAGDDTDGHIDMLARFCPNNTLLYISCDDPLDDHYAPLRAMEEELVQLRNTQDQPYTYVKLPLPRPVTNEAGERLPASYANFLIINQAVLLPTYAITDYNQHEDETAIKILQQVFPDHAIIPIHCTALIHQFGSLHCATMQLPLRNT